MGLWWSWELFACECRLLPYWFYCFSLLSAGMRMQMLHCHQYWKVMGNHLQQRLMWCQMRSQMLSLTGMSQETGRKWKRNSRFLKAALERREQILFFLTRMREQTLFSWMVFCRVRHHVGNCMQERLSVTGAKPLSGTTIIFIDWLMRHFLDLLIYVLISGPAYPGFLQITYKEISRISFMPLGLLTPAYTWPDLLTESFLQLPRELL